MHELGHTLALHHDGNVGGGPNFKPNYLSVMNYAYAVPMDKTTNQGTDAKQAWRLDYSRMAGSALDENLLYEEDPFFGPTGRVILFNSAPEGSPSKINIGWACTNEVDWDFSSTIESDPYALDISNLTSKGIGQYDVLESSTDWDRLWYHLSGTDGFEDQAAWPFAAPAELGLDVGTLIFENGFDLGSTTAWSVTVP